MLVLTRKLNESIVIDDQKIVVTVLRIGSRNVRLGIDAPTETRVRRSEVLQSPQVQLQGVEAQLSEA